MCVCVCVCVCVSVCLSVCLSVCMYVCMYICVSYKSNLQLFKNSVETHVFNRGYNKMC